MLFQDWQQMTQDLIEYHDQSLKEVAAMLNISITSVRRLSKGLGQPHYRTAKKLLRYYIEIKQNSDGLCSCQIT